MSDKLPVIFPRKPKHLPSDDPAVRELQEYIWYMVERLEYLIQLLEKKIDEVE